MQLAKVKEETKEKKPKRTKQKKVKGPKKLGEEEKPHEGDLEEVGFSIQMHLKICFKFAK